MSENENLNESETPQLNIGAVRRSYSLDEVRGIALEYRNACMYGHSHKLTRFELQAELRKIDEKHGLDYKEGVDYNMFNDNQQHINYKSYTMGLRYNQLKSENNGTV